MEKQPMKQPVYGRGVQSLQTMPGISIPLTNEISAVLVGQGLTHPDTTPEARAEAEQCVTKIAAKFDNFTVVYAQNTADTVNICVPEFPDLDGAMENISEEELEQIAGGEAFVICTTAITFALAKIAVICGIGSLGGTFGTLTTLGTIVAGGCIAGGVMAASVLGAGAVAAGIGVGIAASVGAFDSNQAVGVSLAS